MLRYRDHDPSLILSSTLNWRKALLLITTGATSLAGALFLLYTFLPGTTRDDEKPKSTTITTIPTSPSGGKRVYIGGLVNVGNSCYLNAVLQALASIKTLQAVLENPPSGNSVVVALAATLRELRSSEESQTKPFAPTVFIRSMGSGLDHQQQDAHEFLNALLAFLNDVWMQQVLQQKSTLSLILESSHVPVHRSLELAVLPFALLIGSSITCLSCTYQSRIQLTVENCLSCPMSNANSRTLLELSGLLKEYFQPEQMEDVICVRCSRRETMDYITKLKYKSSKKTEMYLESLLTKLTTAHERCFFDVRIPDEFRRVVRSPKSMKHTFVSRWPKILCLHINRQSYDGSRIYKNTLPVSFDEALAVPNNGPEYRLMAMIEHLGNANSGHYITYRKLSGHRWAKVSDERVQYCHWAEVKMKASAYLAFYELSPL